MPMQIRFERTLPLPAAITARLVDSPAAFDYLMFPLLRLRPLDGVGPRLRFDGRPQRLAVRLLGILPVGVQTLDPTWPQAPATAADPGGPGNSHELLDTGGNDLTRSYRHSIRVEPRGAGWSHCIDETDLDAGALTPLVRFSFWLVSWHVQRRWDRLVRLVSV